MKKRIEKFNLKTVIAIAAAIIVFLAAAVFFGSLLKKNAPENSNLLVYRTENQTVVRIDGLEKMLSNQTFAAFKADKDSNRVFFTVDSSYSDGLYDLYYIEKKRSEIKDPVIIDYGVDENFDIVSGKVYYLKKNIDEGAFDGCICDVENGKIETFSGNVDEIFALNGFDKVYFTKIHGDTKVLYAYSGETPCEVCRDVKTSVGYNDDDNSCLIFEKKSAVNEGMTELYFTSANEEPVLVCDNTYSVMYDYYKAGGNLYYFTSGTESVSWSYVISDGYAQSDKSVTKPNRVDYFDFFGISQGYNKALSEYHDKLLRDEIRQALDQTMEQGGFAAPIFNAFVSNSDGVFKIAENIDPQNVYAVSAFGTPKIIFESTQVVTSDVDIATLVDYSQRNNIDDVIEYARSVVNDSVKSNGMAYAAYGSGTGAVTSLLNGYDKSRTLFSFSTKGERIFAFVRSSKGDTLDLYTNGISADLMPSELKIIDTGITGYRFSDDSVVYLKADVGKSTGDVFAFNGNEKTKLSNAANAFTLENADVVISLKEHDASAVQPTADYYFCDGSEETLISNDVIVSSFNCNRDGQTAFISVENGDNRLCVNDGKKTSAVAENVTEILLFD